MLITKMYYFVLHTSMPFLCVNNYSNKSNHFPKFDLFSFSDSSFNILMQTNLEKMFWHDYKGASINAIRTRNSIEKADIVVVRFGEKYKQWNAAFDAGYASALNKSIIVIHSEEHQHALKEVDAAALAVVNEPSKIIDILKYVINSKLK